MLSRDSPYENELILLILDDGHATLIWYYLNWTHPFTI